jgi:hypothetical protein
MGGINMVVYYITAVLKQNVGLTRSFFALTRGRHQSDFLYWLAIADFHAR